MNKYFLTELKIVTLLTAVIFTSAVSVATDFYKCEEILAKHMDNYLGIIGEGDGVQGSQSLYDHPPSAEGATLFTVRQGKGLSDYLVIYDGAQCNPVLVKEVSNPPLVLDTINNVVVSEACTKSISEKVLEVALAENDSPEMQGIAAIFGTTESIEQGALARVSLGKSVGDYLVLFKEGINEACPVTYSRLLNKGSVPLILGLSD